MKTSDLMIVLYVHDMPRAVEFYRDVLHLSVVSESPGWSMLACEGAFIGLHAIFPGCSEDTTRFAGMNLRVEDLDSAVVEVERAGGQLREIRDAEPPHVPVRLAVLQDTEGNVFELRQFIS